MFQNFWSRLSKLPTIAWVILLPLGLVAFIGGTIFIFWALATVEGVGSIVMVVAGWLGVMFAVQPSGAVKIGGQQFNVAKDGNSFAGLITAGVIVWYAIMGMAIDQTGNPLFNYPLRWFCPAESTINRGINVLHPLPGRTDIIQNFACVDQQGEVTKELGAGYLIVTRFIEYLLIAYLMIGLRKLMISGRGK